MRIAYIVNQYPKVSHSFIRREVQALEAQAFQIDRYAVRTDPSELVDARDQAELSRTTVLLHQPKGQLLGLIFASVFAHPIACLGALRLALSLGYKSERGIFLHVIYWAQALILARLVTKLKTDHLHAHFGTNSATLACLTSHISGIPFSFTVHGPEEFDKPEFIGLPEKICRAAMVVAISSYGRSQLFRLVSYEHWNKIKIVHCGLEEDFFTHASSPFPKQPSLLCIGRLCEQKAQLLLIDALSLLKKDGQTPKLVLAGDGPMRAAIEKRIADLDLSAQVTITGWVSSERVKVLLSEATALVLPSFAEGLPVVIMEAMAQGRPVISTYVAGIPELIEPGQTGLLSPAGDVGALAINLKTILSYSPEQLKEMADKASARVAERHSIQTETGKLGAHFKQLEQTRL